MKSVSHHLAAFAKDNLGEKQHMNCSLERTNKVSTALHCAEYGGSGFMASDYRRSN
jgi:hypothetical protein